MMQEIKTIFSNSEPLQALRRALQSNKIVQASGANHIAQAFILNALADRGKPVLCVLPGEEEAEQFYSDLQEISPQISSVLFPFYDRQLWSELGPSAEAIGRKLMALKALLNEPAPVVVMPAAALLEKVVNPTSLRRAQIYLQQGDELYFSDLVQSLVSMGYVREQRVEGPGEISVRGGLLDIFCYEETHPCRIEFFGNTIESIRDFDVENQRSLSSREALTVLPPGSAGPFGPAADHPQEIMKLDSTLAAYLKTDSLVMTAESALLRITLEEAERGLQVRGQTYIEDHKLQGQLTLDQFYETADVVLAQLVSYSQLGFSSLTADHETISFNIQPCGRFAGNITLLKNELQRLEADAHAAGVEPVLRIWCEDDYQTQRMQQLLQQDHFSPAVRAETWNLSAGFIWNDYHVACYSSREIFNRPNYRRGDRISKRQVSLNELTALNEGDIVVHVDYGVGIFRGLHNIKAYGKQRECIKIEYQDGDSLYVPLEKMDRVQKYSSQDGYAPVLSKLGAKDWDRLKTKTKQRVKEIAGQLIKLYALRKLKEGYAFSSDQPWQSELEASFLYEETQDQLAAVQDIKKDMEKPVPMDRLICGDVGFGKTEVAVRAAFKALNDGKQVALLVPTTILAQQHFITFSERLQPYPVRIEMLNRFRKPAAQKEIIQRLKAGKVDLIIGTHRLLSADVEFKDLGLLIVDEEHKFGVLHKEKLKLLKASVDTLTLSATPIPRTMHMALMGARDMSVINTPPYNRRPIKTEVSRFDKVFVREIILKEVERGGQIFFVHNRVQTIYGIASLLRELVPEVRFSVAHGQMDGDELEQIMIDFSEGKIQCLICTMIIESGIDVPNANTLIVNRADRFGLAQLYQLRGRVGRSQQQAYAYLLIPALRKLNRNAIKRLQTIQEYTHLGSGYKIAMRDMEIRGMGNIFGSEQSGYINALGYELYAKIMEEAIRELRQEMNLEPMAQSQDQEPAIESRVEMPTDVYLPVDFVPAASDRVDIYKRLIEAKTERAIEELHTELIDRFGPMPASARDLFDFVLLKLYARKALVDELQFKNGQFIGKFHTPSLPDKEHFTSWMHKILDKASCRFDLRQDKDALYFVVNISKHHNPVETAKKFLQSIL
ncbi:MAG TPA: transcription-repair coupling factor [bacterium]|nr:transcription-repair coupling factor [bacterium]